MNSLLRLILACGVLTGAIAGTAQAAAPVAGDDTYQTPQDMALEVTAPGVLTNDTDADMGDTLTATATSMPGNGNLMFQATGAFTYTPQANFYGTDSFSYEVSDGTTTSNTAMVTLTVTRYGANDGGGGYSSGSYGALSPLTLLWLALAALYPRGLNDSKRRAISP